MTPAAALRVSAWLLAPALLLALLALLAMAWRTATEVHLELLVSRAAFTVAPDVPDAGDARLLDAGKVVALRADGVASLAFAADALAQADPARFDPRQGGFPAGAFSPLRIEGPLMLQATAGAGSVSLEPVDRARPASVQGVVAGGGAEAVLSVGVEEGGRRPWLTLRLDAPDTRAELVVDGGYRIFADGMALSGALAVAPSGALPAAEGLFLRASTGRPAALRLSGADPGLALQLEPPGELPEAQGSAPTDLPAASGIPVSAIDFTAQDASGARRSTLTGPGRLSWPSLPQRPALGLAAGDGVSLARLRQGRLRVLGVRGSGAGAAPGAGLALALDARVSGGRVGRPGHSRDLRLSLFERLWHDPLWRNLLAVLTFGVGLGLGGHRYWRELRGG